jgi:hypothetical protein
MIDLKALIIPGVVAVVLAVLGVTALAVALNPSAAQVAGTTSGTADPALQPPAFYGSR